VRQTVRIGDDGQPQPTIGTEIDPRVLFVDAIIGLLARVPRRHEHSLRWRARRWMPYRSRAMPETLTLSPTNDPHVFRAPDGRLVSPPPGWACLPPGDAGLTRRVKAAGPSWAVIEKKGRKLFSKGLWAPAENIEVARAGLLATRSTETHARRREADQRRRANQQAAYEVDFRAAVTAFLAFAPRWSAAATELSARVTAHAVPVGSGTVARTQRISVEERAEAAVIAWMRHQTTAYDNLAIPRVKGMRRQVRRQLADVSRAVLDLHRRDQDHPQAMCPLCVALAKTP